jgi:hypothetical protein
MAVSGSDVNLLKFAQAFEHEQINDDFEEHWGVRGSTMSSIDA